MVAGIFGISVLVTGCDSSNSPAQSASENTTSEQRSNHEVTIDSAQAAKPLEQKLKIAAAANLASVLPKVIDSYEHYLVSNQIKQNLQDQGITNLDLDIEVSYASSGKLYTQITAGAPYDIYLAANQDYPKQLNDDLLKTASVETESGQDKTDLQAQNEHPISKVPFTYTQGQLALYSTRITLPNNLEGGESTDSALANGQQKNSDPTQVTTAVDISNATINSLIKSANKIAIANPDLAPYGAAAKSYLQAQGLYNDLFAQKKLLNGENIGQAFQYTDTGNADIGFVALSQVLAANNNNQSSYLTLPASSYPAILQDGLILQDNPITQSFVDYLLSDEAQQIFADAGYIAIQKPEPPSAGISGIEE